MEGFCKHINISRPPLITLQSAIKISLTTPQQDKIYLQDIPKSMLHKIMMFDSNSRQLPRYEIDSAKPTMSTLSIIKSLSRNTSSGDNTEVHPMDVFLFLFIQCNPMFRQTYITQVSKLQLSIPLITSYPSVLIPTFYIFSLKTLYKDYFDGHIGRSFSVTEEKLPIISFIRIGECDKSQKSEMLNQIIEIPDYFFHRNQLGNVRKRYFLDGTVEIAWLLPTDEHLLHTHEEISYNYPCTVLNLRGNAQSYSKQLDFITSVSALVYVFISINEINENFSETLVRFYQDYGSKSVFLLYQGEALTSQFEPIIPNFLGNTSYTVLILNKHSLREDSNKVAINISDNLLKMNSITKISLVDCIPIARRLLIPIDLDEHNIGVCQSNVDQMLHHISQQDSLAAVKQDMLPLQGDCWSRWTKAKRESHKFVLQEHIDSAVLEMDTAREEQLTKLRNPSSLLKDVINLCREFGYSQEDFYIVWNILKNSFNDLSRQRLPPLYEEYHKWHKLSCSTDDDTMDTDDKFAKQKESKEMLLSAGKNLARSSLGIEHIFRELGQVFESRIALSSRKQKMNLNRDLDFQVETLKEVAAKLIVVGHTFEIVDGDTNYIATDWVTSVLESVAYIVGVKKKIFVLSILGTQSTGKSTLLNTMFGANFPISSGRCTRGIFMQLIPIEEKLRSKLRYDYLVILDTEGLRTPELSINSVFRGDNELATLSIGLGDVTILNMYGEGHTDVQDILQISIFAFIRMKQSYSKPRCIFVHHNVPDTHAQTNLLTARSNLIRTLNEITECAAQQENVQVFYNKFSDVIEFHPDDEVFYFPGLFEGEPPKSRISSGYSRKASKLRQYVLECFQKHPNKNFTTILDWSNKLQTLWNSILKENFVFSYRNALEVTSRFQLDHKLSSWHSNYIQSLNSHKSESLNQLFNADFTQLDATWNRINSVLTKERMCPSIEISSEDELMQNYFSTHENVEIYSKWKADTAEYFTKRREKHIDKMEKEFLVIYNLQKTKKAMDVGFIKSRQTIVSKVKELFFEIPKECSLTKRQFIDSKFQNVWEEWKSTIEVFETEIHDISRDLQRSLLDSVIIKSMCLMSTRQSLLSDERNYINIGKGKFNNLSTLYNNEDLFYFTLYDIDDKSDMCVGYIKDVSSNTTNDAGLNQFRTSLKILGMESERKINEQLDVLLIEECPYDPNSFHIIIDICYSIVHKHNTAQSKHIHQILQLTNDFIFDFIFYHCCKALPKLQSIHDNFITKTNLDVKFNNLEINLKNIFHNLCEGIQIEYLCASELSKIVSCGMKEILSDSVTRFLFSHFRVDPKNNAIFQDRPSLILHVLKNLARSKKFDDYIMYIKSPTNYLCSYIQNHLKEFSRRKSTSQMVVSTVRENIETLIDFYILKCRECIQDEDLFSINLPTFKFEFYSKIVSKVRNVSYNDLDVLDIHTISNYTQFCDLFDKELRLRVKETDWEDWVINILEEDCSLYRNVTYTIMECEELCPFCNELCQLSCGNHEHYCGTFHRPMGLTGWRNIRTRAISSQECTMSLKVNGMFRYHGIFYRYVDYKTVNLNFASWKILADDALEAKYWRWVICTFEGDFVNYYNIRRSSRIRNWKNLTEEEVIEDLESHYQMYIFRKT